MSVVERYRELMNDLLRQRDVSTLSQEQEAARVTALNDLCEQMTDEERILIEIEFARSSTSTSGG